MDNNFIQANSVATCINHKRILNNVNFSLAKASVTSIIGPSGSGKSTLLRTIAGFQSLCDGELIIDGEVVDNVHKKCIPEKRKIGVVFQDAPLFQHLTVEENIKVGMKQSFAKIKQVGKYLNYLIDLMQLQELQYRYAHELSGGQQQRVALARALAMDTKVMLLDEPFANLNEDLHMQVAEKMFNWFYDRGTTVMLVTHDQYDAMAISDNVLVLMDGQTVQQDSAEDLFDAPKNKHIASFLNRGSLIAGQLVASKREEKSHTLVLHKVTKHEEGSSQNNGLTIKPSKSIEFGEDDIEHHEMYDFAVITPFGKVRLKPSCVSHVNGSLDKDVLVWTQPEDFTVVCVNENESGCFGIANLLQGEISRMIWRTTDILLHVHFAKNTFKSVIISAEHHDDSFIKDYHAQDDVILVKVSQSGAFHRSQPFAEGQKVMLALKNHEYNAYL